MSDVRRSSLVATAATDRSSRSANEIEVLTSYRPRSARRRTDLRIGAEVSVSGPHPDSQAAVRTSRSRIAKDSGMRGCRQEARIPPTVDSPLAA